LPNSVSKASATFTNTEAVGINCLKSNITTRTFFNYFVVVKLSSLVNYFSDKVVKLIWVNY